MRQLFVLAGLGGCATATTPLEGTDAGVDARIDSPTAPIDSPTPCTVTTVNLLTNPAFEMVTAGWMETRIGSAAIVRNDGAVAAHTPTYKAWMGGVVAPLLDTVRDALWQDVMVPAGTTQLVLTGQYEVRTAETSTTTAYDTGTVALVQTNGTTVIQSILALDNKTPTTVWTPINHAFTQALAGQTVQLRFASRNDYTNATSFYFDSLALMATSCPP